MPTPARPEAHPTAKSTCEDFHSQLVEEAARMIQEHDVVVIGMGWNPFVKQAKKALTEADIPFEYLEIGNYSCKWKERLAIKMWSGWPTFPQVYVKGALLGGAKETDTAIQDGTLTTLLA